MWLLFFFKSGRESKNHRRTSPQSKLMHMLRVGVHEELGGADMQDWGTPLHVVFNSTELLLNHTLQCTPGIHSVSFQDNQSWYGSLIKLKCPACYYAVSMPKALTGCWQIQWLYAWTDANSWLSCLVCRYLVLALSMEGDSLTLRSFVENCVHS